MSFGKAFRLVAVILVAITVVLAVICGVTIVRTQAFLSDSTIASGRVVGLVPRQSCDEDDRCSTTYAPRVRFTTADGRQVIFVSDTSADPPAYEQGAPVDVRYRATDPTDARIDSVAGIWLGALITGGLTLFFAAFCVVWIVLAVRFRKA